MERSTADLSSDGELRIVAIDDNPGDLRLLETWLMRLTEWRIDLTCFVDPAEALREVSRCRPDVVITDQFLGKSTGLDLLRSLKGLHVTVPVVLTTGSGNESVAADALREGAADYIPKDTLNIESLRRSIGNAVEKARLRESIRLHQARLSRTVEKLRRRNCEIQSFYHTVSHELKTPLTATREFVSIVLDGLAGTLETTQREYLETAQRGCDKIRSLVDDMVDISRLETGKLNLQLVSLAPSKIVRDVEATWSRLEHAGLELTVDVQADLPDVLADELRIYQVLGNLLSNAIKFTPPGGNVRLAAALGRSGKSVVFSVRDTGCGIEAKDRDAVFERLYQVSESTVAEGGGLGLGLYVCRELVRLHGGKITMRSEVGVGSDFSFDLPLAKPPESTTP